MQTHQMFAMGLCKDEQLDLKSLGCECQTGLDTGASIHVYFLTHVGGNDFPGAQLVIHYAEMLTFYAWNFSVLQLIPCVFSCSSLHCGSVTECLHLQEYLAAICKSLCCPSMSPAEVGADDEKPPRAL